jgi:hypothetical protein
MEQIHWWKEDKYWHRGEACRNEGDNPLFLEMIYEATRLGIQQGKREALEDVLNLLNNECEGEHKATMLNAAMLKELFEEELSSLDNSSKDKV